MTASKQYRKKPVVINAIQFVGGVDNCIAIEQFTDGKVIQFVGTPPHELKITTLEEMTASLNDYIIKGVMGEFYPCKPDIFNATYEEVK